MLLIIKIFHKKRDVNKHMTPIVLLKIKSCSKIKVLLNSP